MRLAIHPFILFLFCNLTIFAQQNSNFQALPASKIVHNRLDKTFADYYLFDLSSIELKSFLQTGSGEKNIQLNMPGLGVWPITLRPNHFLHYNYRLTIDHGDRLEQRPAAQNITWLGHWTSDPSLEVSLTVDDHFIFGTINTPQGRFFIEPLRYLLDGSAADRYIVYRTDALLPNPELQCGVKEVASKKNEVIAHDKPEMVGDCKHVEIAIASAYDMFQRYGTVNQVETHNIGVMNEVGTDYDNAFDDQIYYVIATQYVSTTTTSSLDVALTSSTSANVILDNFTAWGNAGNFGVVYDIGQLWTARDFDGSTIGLAWVGEVCASNRYHVLQDYAGQNNNGTGWQLRVMTSHEIGHNFDCQHTESGTIMFGSVNNTTTWSNTSLTEVNNFLTTISCLSICGINFESSVYRAGEGVGPSLGAGPPTCDMPYNEYDVPIVYSGPPTGGAVTVSVTGGTAVENLDFDIPSTTVTFPAGSTTALEYMTIRVWNDAVKEGGKTINLSLSGTGTGAQDMATVNLRSDDVPPNMIGYPYGIIGAGNIGISAPFRGSQADCRTQFVLGAPELQSLGFHPDTAAVISGLALFVASKTSTQPYGGFTIKMQHTTDGTGYSGNLRGGSFLTVYNANYTTTNNAWNKFDFITPFVWDGTSNVRIEMCYNNASSTGNDIVRGSSGTTIFQQQNTNVTPGCSLAESSWFNSSARPNIRLFKANDIAVTLNDEADSYMDANGQTCYFKDAQNEFIMAVRHISGTVPGCINVKIDRAGISRQTPPWMGAGSFISDKTFLITADNTSANLEITLYYSNSETTVWGSSAGSLNIIASDQAISSSNASNCIINTSVTRAQFGPSDAPTAYRSYRATFTGGRVGFALTNASVLPVELINFNGRWEGRNARLEWLTSIERDNEGFDIERSNDGLTFEKIGFVPAKTVLSSQNIYEFLDLGIADNKKPVFYYRLKQRDINGEFAYSNTIALFKSGQDTEFALFPNPAQDRLTLAFSSSCQNCEGILRIYDAAGRLVLQFPVKDSLRQTIDVSTLSPGWYLGEFQRDYDGITQQLKWVKK